jgi:hypothetical protein
VWAAVRRVRLTPLKLSAAPSAAQVSVSNPPITVAALLTHTSSPTGGAGVGGSSASLGGSKKSASKSPPLKSPPRRLPQALDKEIQRIKVKRKGKGKGTARFTPSPTSLKDDFYRDGSAGGDGPNDAGYIEEEKEVRQHSREDVMEELVYGDVSEEEEDEDYEKESEEEESEEEESEDEGEDEVEESEEGEESEEDEDEEEEEEEVVVVEMEEVEDEDEEEAVTDYTLYCITKGRVEEFGSMSYKLFEEAKLLHRVVLCLQNDEDEKNYNESYPNLKSIRTPPSLHRSANYVTNEIVSPGDRFGIVHDNLREFKRLQRPSDTEGLKLVPVTNLDDLFKEGFRALKKNGCSLLGFYPVPNVSWMAKLPGITTDLRFCHNPCILMIGLAKCIELTEEMCMKQDFQRTIMFYELEGRVVRFNHISFVTKFNPKNTKGGVGHRDAASEKESTRIFENKYGAYIRNTLTHSDGSTSFVLNPNAERQRLAALSPKDAVPPRPQRPNLEMPDVDSQVHAVGISGCSSREGRERQYEEWTVLRQRRRAQARAQVHHRSKSARFDEEVAQLVASSSSVYDSVKRRRR